MLLFKIELDLETILPSVSNYFYLVVEEILWIHLTGGRAGLRLRIAFTAIMEHKRNTGWVIIAAASTLCQRNKAMDGPDVVSTATTRSHCVAFWDLVVEHVLWVFHAGLGAGPGFWEAFSPIKMQE